EYGDGCTRIDTLAFAERVGELLVGNEAAFALGAKSKALVEAHEVRRGIDVHAQSRSLQDRARESHGRALAIGAGDMDGRRRPPLRIPERRQNAPHTIERQVDALRMQCREPRNDGVDGTHFHLQARSRIGAWRYGRPGEIRRWMLIPRSEAASCPRAALAVPWSRACRDLQASAGDGVDARPCRPSHGP